MSSSGESEGSEGSATSPGSAPDPGERGSDPPTGSTSASVGEVTPARSNEDAREEIYRLLAEGRTQRRPRLVPDRDTLVRLGLEQDLELKRNYGRRLLYLVIGQLFIADAVFIAYAWAGRGWNLPSSVIYIWLAATLVELLGIVYVIVNYLFPKSGADV